MEYKHENMKSKRTVGDNLKDILVERNLTASKLAKFTELDASYIYDIIKNKNINPSIRVLIKISKALKIDIVYLIKNVDFD